MELSSNVFKEKCEILFSKTRNIFVAMFIFGFCMQRKDKAGKRIFLNLIDNPIKEELRGQWDESTWAKIRRGSEHSSPTNEEEADSFPLSGILFVMRQLYKANELKHPDWGMFYIIGEALGRYNSEEISQVEFEYFLTQIPIPFMEKHIDIIKDLCNEFDEKGEVLNLYVKENKILAYYTS